MGIVIKDILEGNMPVLHNKLKGLKQVNKINLYFWLSNVSEL